MSKEINARNIFPNITDSSWNILYMLSVKRDGLWWTIYRIFSNLIRTSFCRFLKRKKKLVRGSNPHLWEDDGEDKDDSDWVTDSDSGMSDDGECGE